MSQGHKIAKNGKTFGQIIKIFQRSKTKYSKKSYNKLFEYISDKKKKII